MVNIALLTIDDYTSFLPIFQEVHNIHYQNAPWFFKKFDETIYSRNKFQQDVVNKDCIFLKATKGDKMIGYVKCNMYEINSNPMLESLFTAMIEQIAVKFEYRGNGIGKKLMIEIENELRIKKINDYELTVWSFNQEAISMYESMGLQKNMIRYRKNLISIN